MGLFDSLANITQDLPKGNSHQFSEPRSVIITNQIGTLPLHLKITLYACIRLLDKDKKDFKVTVGDVFDEYEKLTAEANTYSLSNGNVINYIKELELLGFLKCTYISKVPGRIRSIRIYDPDQIPKYVSILKEDLYRDKLASIPYHLKESNASE
jgi:Cdc6-like AAA superfamily ATPase